MKVNYLKFWTPLVLKDVGNRPYQWLSGCTILKVTVILKAGKIFNPY